MKTRSHFLPIIGALALTPSLLFGQTGTGDWILYGAVDALEGNGLGTEVAALNDMNGDGVPDFLVGAQDFKVGTHGQIGAVIVYSGLDMTPIWTVTSADIGISGGDPVIRGLGVSVARVNDITGDGVDDVIAGAAFEQSGGAGDVVVLSGADGALLYRFTGAPYDSLGFSVAAADVDGDGMDDFIAGAPALFASGYVTVFSGSTGAQLWTQAGSGGVGYSVAAADVNGNGRSEVIVGTPRDSVRQPGWYRDGSLRIFDGPSGAQLLHVDGYLFGEGQLGWSVSSIGDLDGDGNDDVLVGQPAVKVSGYIAAGRVLALSGITGAEILRIDGTGKLMWLGWDVASIGDIDGDGADDILSATKGPNRAYLSSSADGSRLATFSHPNNFGYRVAGLGDLNQDSVPEILIGSPIYRGPNGTKGGQISIFTLKLPNSPPTAIAGSDQSIRAGEIVTLDGSASFDDNTSSALLEYSWSFDSAPPGSQAILNFADTEYPSFIADAAGTFVVQLVVTDEGGLSSVADEVEISTDNLAPTAVATVDSNLVISGSSVQFDGSGSSDPEMDPLSFSWSITSMPVGSNAALVNELTVAPALIPDFEGTYMVKLVVSDFLGEGIADTVEFTVTSALGYAEMQVISACDLVSALPLSMVTTKGNQNAYCNFLSQAIKELQKGKIDNAIDKLEQAMERSDGCVLRGAPDGNGGGRDWIIDCGAQVTVYGYLHSAVAALQL